MNERADRDPAPTDDTVAESADDAIADAGATAEAGLVDATAATDGAPAPTVEGIDLAAITADLDGVEAALRRLDDGTYWTDEVTGEAIPDEVLVANPVARRVG